MKTFELTPTNGRKSFGGKAKVIEQDNKVQLLSYSTIVCELDLTTGEFTLNGTYSNTTLGHIKAFKQFYSVL